MDKTITIPFDSAILWGLLSFAIIVFFIMTLILHYHWKSYGLENNPKIFAKSLYWVISVAVILLMTVLALIFEGGI